MLIYSVTYYLRLMSISYVLTLMYLFAYCSVFAVKARNKNNFGESKWDFFREIFRPGLFLAKLGGADAESANG